MTFGKAGGLCGERLKDANKPVCRLKATRTGSSPFKGEVGRGMGLLCE